MKKFGFFIFLFMSVFYLQQSLGCPCSPPPPAFYLCNCELKPNYEASLAHCINHYTCGGVTENGCNTAANFSGPLCAYPLPLIDPPPPPRPPNTPSTKCGSIVEIETQTLRENIPVLGSKLDLLYSSERVIGRKDNFEIPFRVEKPTDTDPNVTEVFIVHTVDGVETETNFPSNTNVNYMYQWNGLNSSSNEVIDGVLTKIEVEFEITNTTRSKVAENNFNIGFYNAKLLGLGGFTLSNHHFYNLKLKTLHLGDGNDRIINAIKVEKSGDLIEKLADEATSFTNYLVVSEDGNEAYVFDTLGYHIETRSVRTSKILTSFAYDLNKRLTSIEDAFGNEITITRPNSTTVVIETPSGKTTTMTLNADRFATVIETPNAEEYLMTYSSVAGAKGLMTQFEDPKGKVSTFTYDAKGRLLEDSNNAGQTLELNVVTDQPNLKLIEAISAQGRITQYYTNLLGSGNSRAQITNPTGATSIENRTNTNYQNFRADGSGTTTTRISNPRFSGQVFMDNSTVLTLQADSHSVSQSNHFTYSDTDLLNLTNHTRTVTFDAKNWVTSYDNLTQTYTETTPLNRQIKTTYNNFDQVTQTQHAAFSPVVYDYDARGRLEGLSQNTRAWSYVYNAEDEVQSITNPLNQITSHIYDNNGRVIETTYPNLEKAYFEYDEVGNIKKIKGGTKPWHELVYNLFGGVVKYIMPSLGSGSPQVQYTYNADKQLTKITRENNSTINFSYGSQTALLKQIQAPEGIYVYTTNSATEQLQKIKAPNNVEIGYTYLNEALQIQSIKDGTNESKYRYDYAKMLPNKITLSHQDSNSNVSHETDITYNNDRLMTLIGVQTLTRTAATGFVSATSLTGGMNEQYTYDANFGEVASYTARFSTTQKYKEVYTRDLLGRTSKRVETINANPVRTFDFIYDSRGRFRQAKLFGVLQRRYFYDSNSNRISIENGSAAQIAAGTYNDQDQLLTYQIKNVTGTVLNNYTYTYNDFGQRLTKIDSTNNVREEYVYNSLGALTNYVRKNNTTLAVLKTIVYKNDAKGRRITKTEDTVLQTRYIYDEGIKLVGEVTPDGDTLTHYVYADKSHTPAYMNRAGVNYKFITNEQGSVRFVMNATTGAAVQEITYDEFGNITADTNPGFQPFGFAGGVYDPDTKLTRFGARDYDAEVGRWTAKDPIRFNGGDTNLYGYVLQDPVNFIDPYGLSQMQIDSARQYLGNKYPGFDQRNPTMTDSRLIPSGTGLTLPFNRVLINTNGMSDAEVFDMVVHETIHNNEGFLPTILGFGTKHDNIYREAAEKGCEFRGQ